eukprot:GFUD01033507.1.p1 GENE.GFUD01033507.1~~GFUD01033507.1.p1  ORF type:complete len:463 (-),score=120.96 GFUD01033507.1:64-1452(-)
MDEEWKTGFTCEQLQKVDELESRLVSAEEWKIGLTCDQLQKVEELESSLVSATSKLQQKDDFEMSRHESQAGPRNVVNRIHEASTDSGTSPSPHPTVSISCPSPTSPLPLPNTSQPENVDTTSPSFRSLNSGYVSSLADFWANKWKKVDEDCSKDCQEEHGKGLENNEQLAENNPEVIKEVKDTTMAQCDHLRASEEENVKLKGDVKALAIQNEEILAYLDQKDESLMIEERENLRYCNEKVSKLLKEVEEKNCKICELEGKLEKSVEEKNRLNQDLKETFLKFEDLQVKNGNLQTAYNEYEAIVKELRDQFVPNENLKAKLGFLDKDVKLLRMRLQASVSSSSKSRKIAEANGMTRNLPIRRSMKIKNLPSRRSMRRPKDDHIGSKVRIMKKAETTLTLVTKKPVEKEVSASSDSGQQIALARNELESSELDSAKSSIVVPDASLSSKSKKGRRSEDCKQQ